MSVMYKIAKEGALPEMPPSTSGTEIHKHTHTHTHTHKQTHVYICTSTSGTEILQKSGPSMCTV